MHLFSLVRVSKLPATIWAALIALAFMVGCDSQLQTEGLTLVDEADLNADVSTVEPGKEFALSRITYSDGIKVQIDEKTVDSYANSDGKLAFKIPSDAKTKKLKIVLIHGAKRVQLSNIYSVKTDDHPLISMKPENVCKRQKFYDDNGKLQEGLKDCTPPDPNLLPENIKSGIVIGGVVGTAGAEKVCAVGAGK